MMKLRAVPAKTSLSAFIIMFLGKYKYRWDASGNLNFALALTICIEKEFITKFNIIFKHATCSMLILIIKTYRFSHQL